MLKGLHEMTTRIEQLSQAEHDLIREVHPQVGEIKEHVENVAEAVAPESSRCKRIDAMICGEIGMKIDIVSVRVS